MQTKSIVSTCWKCASHSIFVLCCLLMFGLSASKICAEEVKPSSAIIAYSDKHFTYQQAEKICAISKGRLPRVVSKKMHIDGFQKIASGWHGWPKNIPEGIYWTETPIPNKPNYVYTIAIDMSTGHTVLQHTVKSAKRTAFMPSVYCVTK